MKYVLTFLAHSLHKLGPSNTSQATLWANKEHFFIQSVKLKDARIVFF